MPLYKKSKNPKVLRAIEPLQELLVIIARDLAYDRLAKIRCDLLNMAVVAVRGDDAELFSAILFVESEFLTIVIGQNKLDKIALFFEVELSTVLMLAKIQRQQHSNYFFPFLYNYNIMKLYNDGVITKIPPVDFRLAVYQHLKTQQVVDNLPLLNKPTKVAKLLTSLQEAFANKEQVAAEYFTNIITYLIEDALVYDKVQDLAVFIAGYVELLINSKTQGMKATFFYAIGMEPKNFSAEDGFFTEDFSQILMWLMVNANGVFGKIARVNGISHEQLVKFQDAVGIALAKLKQKPKLLADFSELLGEVTIAIKQERQSSHRAKQELQTVGKSSDLAVSSRMHSITSIKHLLAINVATEKPITFKELEQSRTANYFNLIFNILAQLINSIKHLDAVTLANQITEIINTSITYYQRGYIKELVQLFDWSINELEQSIILLQAKAYGQLAWDYIEQFLKIDIIAEQNNIPFSQYVAFKQAVYAELTKLLQTPVLPELTTLNAEILAIASKNKLLADNKSFVFFHQLRILFREAYVQKDSETFAALIRTMAAMVRELYALGTFGINNLVSILQIIPKQILLLVAALEAEDPSKLIKTLIDIAIIHCDWHQDQYKNPEVKKQPFTDREFAIQQMQAIGWQAQKPDENYILKAEEFQLAVYAACGLATKKEELGKLTDGYIWPWSEVPLLGKDEINDFVIDAMNGSISLVHYHAITRQKLMAADFVALEQQRIIRRQLLDVAYFKNDPTLYAELVWYDLELLLLAFAEDKIVQVQILLNISIEKIKFYYTLYKEQALAELSWHLLHAISWQDIAIATKMQEQRDIIKLQANAGQLLMARNSSRGGCQLPTGAQLGNSLQTGILETKVLTWSRLANSIKTLLQDLIKQTKYSSIAVQQLARFLHDLVEQSIAIYYSGNKNIVILLQALIPLEFHEIELLFMAKHSKLLVWNLLNSSKIFWPKEDLAIDLIMPQLNPGKIATIVALQQYYALGDKKEFLQGIENFSVVELVTTDFVKLRLFQLEIISKIISQIQQGDHLGCAKSLLTAMQIIMRLKDNFSAVVHYLLAVPESLTVEYYSCLQQENYELLLRLIYLEILRKNRWQLLAVDNQEICTFSIALFQELAKLLARTTLLWSPEEAANNYEALFVVDELLLSKQKAMENLHLLQVTIQRALLDAYELDKPQQYAVWIKLQIDMLLKAYKLGKQEILVSIFAGNYKDVAEALALLKLENIAALQAWYVAYSISNSKNKSWSVMISKMRWQGDITEQSYGLTIAFKEAVYEALAISPIEIFLDDKSCCFIRKEGLQMILDSIRQLANQHFDLKIYEEKLSELGKLTAVAELLQLDSNIPSISDSQEYQEIYQLLQVIWYSHILGHIMSVIVPTIQLGKFNLRWEGSRNLSMVKIMQHSHQEFMALPANIAKIAKICRQVVPAIGSAELAKFVALLTQEVSKIIAFDIVDFVDQRLQGLQYNSEEELNNKLRNGELIAIAVATYFPELHAGHATGALFLEDIFVKTDRGGDAAAEFSGISFYQMRCPLEVREAVIKELATSEGMDNEHYKELQRKLQLKLIYRVPMLAQLRGNCGHASCAELLHFGVAIFEVAKLLMAKQQQSFIQVLKTACVVAKQINTLVMQYQQLKTLAKFLALLQAPNSLLSPPYEFLAHVYLIAKFHLGHQGIVDMLEKTGYITAAQCDKVIADYKKYIAEYLIDEISVGAREALPQKLLTTAVAQVLQEYFTVDNYFRLRETYDNGVICLEYGITNKQLQALLMVPRPLGNEPQSLVITISNAVIANMRKSWQRLNNDRLMNSLLVEILAAARTQGIVQQVSWHEVMPGVYWPKLIKLKVSIQEFLAFITKTMQQGSHPGSELLLPLFTSASKAQKIFAVTPSGMAIKESFRQSCRKCISLL